MKNVPFEVLRRLRAASGLGLTIVAATMVLTSMPTIATAAIPTGHGSLVPQTPRADTPVILDGRVNANVQFGNLIVVAGLFTQVELPDGTIVDQQNLMAYDINSGAMAEWFNPDINGEVLALESADDGSGLFLGGKFSKIDGIARFKIAKLDHSGEVDAGFVANADAKIQALDDDGTRLFVGGSFTEVNGIERIRLAAVDVTSGAVDSFRNDVTGPIGNGGSGAVRRVDIHPSGDLLLVAHSSTQVAGSPRTGLAQIDLTTDLLTAWQTEWYSEATTRCNAGGLTIRDAEYALDGDSFFVVEKGGKECAKIVAFPTADTAGQLEQNLWVTAAFDSVYSVGLSDVGVYVGGHFCFVEPLGPIDSNDVAAFTFDTRPEPCGFGNVDHGDVVARAKLAALDPATGIPLDWNPTTTAFEATFDIEVIDRGLLLGQDRDSVGGVVTGRHSFIEVPPNPNPPNPNPTPAPNPTPDPTPPDPPVPAPMPDPVPDTEDGYFLLSADGGVFGFGDGTDLGNVRLSANSTAVAISTTSTGAGYLVVGSDWTVYSFGDAPIEIPDLTGLAPDDVPVDVAVDPLGRGYWIFSANGTVITVGNVPHYGDANNINLNQPIVAASITKAGNGYRLLAADGGVFTYGNAPFHGSIPQILPNQTLNCPIVGIVDANNTGYWLVACDGGIFAFGNAPFVGSLPGLNITPNQPVNGMVPYVDGYLLIAQDGGVFAFGGPFQGSLGNITLTAPITAITTR